MKTMPSHSVTDKQLRSFGLLLAAALTTIFGVLLPWFWAFSYPIWPWVLSLPLLIFAILKPSMLKTVYLAWMKIGTFMGWVNTRVILGVVFYFVFMPAGILMRILRVDPMNRTMRDGQDTYRVPSVQVPPEQMEKPF